MDTSLEHAIRGCRKCGLSMNMTPVSGRGDKSSLVVFISKNPTCYEQGSGGSFFNKMLEEAGLDRDDVAMLSLVKCSDTTELPSRIKNCLPWLKMELKWFENKKIIVPLGNEVCTRILNKPDFTVMNGGAGRIYRMPDGAMVIPMFHPRQCLRAPYAARRALTVCRTVIRRKVEERGLGKERKI